jgi:hypothetical protein
MNKRLFPPLIRKLTPSLLTLLLMTGCSLTIHDPRSISVDAADRVAVAFASEVPQPYVNRLREVLASITLVDTTEGPRLLTVLEQPVEGATMIKVGGAGANSVPIMERYFAAVVPFATLQDDITLAELQMRWQGAGAGVLVVASDVANLLSARWGAPTAPVMAADALLPALEAQPEAVGLIAFDRLDPRFKVLTVDGVNVLSNQLASANYPLAVSLTVDGPNAAVVAALLQQTVAPATNRAADRLTTLIMTGVTAMSRATAARMERMGVLYPAAIISNTLAAADITHVSNEAPFLDDCVVNNTENNLILCSHTSYWAALEAIGTDIVGLSGNHVNDFGRDGARRSLQFYRDNEIPIYGSGLTIDEACAPLYWEHNGNRFAFVAVLAFGPESAWVTESEPGACYYYERKEQILETVRRLAQEVDIVSVELQYTEIYSPTPSSSQVVEFRELRTAGADIVTGVQSHVPQAMEPYGYLNPGGPGIIVYGLGNLFFDQMWSWETRTELYARHTIYNGRVISTEILTGILEGYAQPRWATPEERAGILRTIFAASPARP